MELGIVFRNTVIDFTIFDVGNVFNDSDRKIMDGPSYIMFATRTSD